MFLDAIYSNSVSIKIDETICFSFYADELGKLWQTYIRNWAFSATGNNSSVTYICIYLDWKLIFPKVIPPTQLEWKLISGKSHTPYLLRMVTDISPGHIVSQSMKGIWQMCATERNLSVVISLMLLSHWKKSQLLRYAICAIWCFPCQSYQNISRTLILMISKLINRCKWLCGRCSIRIWLPASWFCFCFFFEELHRTPVKYIIRPSQHLHGYLTHGYEPIIWRSIFIGISHMVMNNVL